MSAVYSWELASKTRRSAPIAGSGAAPVTGLIFPLNGAANSDIGLDWSGSDLLSRTSHTAIWQIAYNPAVAGFVAVTWHCHGDATFHSDTYEYGAHLYPCSGAVEVDGRASDTGGSSGTTHYEEVAGLNGSDYIASAGNSAAFLEPKDGAFRWKARKCEVIGGTTLRHTYFPDVVGQPSLTIVHDIALADLTSPSSPRFRFGCSPWTVTGSTNAETPNGTLRGMKLFSAPLSITDITSEINSGGNAPVTSAGIANPWYSNINPTPSDMSDKSGAGHSPVWANSNRPSLYTG